MPSSPRIIRLAFDGQQRAGLEVRLEVRPPLKSRSAVCRVASDAYSASVVSRSFACTAARPRACDLEWVGGERQIELRMRVRKRRDPLLVRMSCTGQISDSTMTVGDTGPRPEADEHRALGASVALDVEVHPRTGLPGPRLDGSSVRSKHPSRPSRLPLHRLLDRTTGPLHRASRSPLQERCPASGHATTSRRRPEKARSAPLDEFRCTVRRVRLDR